MTEDMQNYYNIHSNENFMEEKQEHQPERRKRANHEFLHNSYFDDETRSTDSEYEEMVASDHYKTQTNTKFKIKTQIEIQYMERVGIQQCCEKNCVRKYNTIQITTLRKKLWEKSRTDRIIFIQNASSANSNGSKRKYFINHEKVCVQCFCVCYGISRRMLYAKTSIHHQPHRTRKTYESIISFLRKYSSYGNNMPNSNEIHLPYKSKKQLYEIYMENVESKPLEYVSSSYRYFNKVWNTTLRNVKVVQSIRFTKCGKCTRLKEKQAATQNETQKLKLKTVLFKHYARMKLDREVYSFNKTIARIRKTELLSIVIDGADFQKYGLPYFAQKDKDTDKGYKIPIRMVAARVHGHGEVIFTVNSNLPSDSNSLIHCLHQTISYTKFLYDTHSKQFPKKLALQVI